MSSQPEGRKPKDREFLRTREGMFFCVTGYLHPPERYTAYLKYSPDPLGKWRDAETAYRRELPYYHVRNVAETIGYLEQHYPWHVHYCTVYVEWRPVFGAGYSLFDGASRLRSLLL